MPLSFSDTATLRQSSRAVVSRVGMPLLLFGTGLTLLLVLSQALLLPRLTQLKVHGQLMDSERLRAYEETLLREVRAQEAQRSVLIEPVQDELYGALKERKRSVLPFDRVRAEIEAVAARVSGEAGPRVLFSRFAYDPFAATLEIAGDVRDAGPGSMTVLAEFVDLLKSAPSVEGFSAPSFAREQDPAIGFYSPFALTLRLRSL